MIKSIEQCRAIQQSRVKNNQYGYAKAVRRFVAELVGGTKTPEYSEQLKQLPVSWIKAEKEKPKPTGSVTVPTGDLSE